MIRSIADPETQIIWDRGVSRRLPQSIQRAAFRKLAMLDRAAELNDLRTPPGNRLEPLRGNRLGQWSIRINDQYRICFRFVEEGPDAGAHDVEIVDYH